MDAFYSLSSYQAANRLSPGPDESGFRSVWGIILCLCSVFVHLVLAWGLFFIQGIPPKRVLPQVIQVDLVSLALPGEVAATPGGGVKTAVKEERVIPAPPKPETVKTPVKETVKIPGPVHPKPQSVVEKKSEPAKAAEPVTVAEPTVKFALKKKTFKADKVMESARESIKKKVETSSTGVDTTLERAFSRLEKAVEAQAGSRPVAGVAGVSDVGSKGDKSVLTPIDLYNVELMYRIRQNWAFNERLAKAEQGIQARVLIKILKNGQIRDVWFETRSGNRYLDESALKAVKKSNPLPPLPKGYVTYDLGLQFTPSGLK